jgi:iron complex outermembrane receptor protein
VQSSRRDRDAAAAWTVKALPPTSYVGTVDANIIPQALVQRVDVVTGGASAAYGSDAVAGVVNFVLDTKFDGVKGSVTIRHLEPLATIIRWKFGPRRRQEPCWTIGCMWKAASIISSSRAFANNGERPYGGNYDGGWVECRLHICPVRGTNTVANGCPASGCAAGTKQNPYTPTFNVRLANGTYGTLDQLRVATPPAPPCPSRSTINTFEPGGSLSHPADLGTPDRHAQLQHVGGQ